MVVVVEIRDLLTSIIMNIISGLSLVKLKVFKIRGLAKMFLKLFLDIYNEEEPSLELAVIDSHRALVTHWRRSIPGFVMQLQV